MDLKVGQSSKQTGKNRRFRIMVLEKITTSFMDSQKNKPDCSLEASMVKLKLPYFRHTMRRYQTLKKDIMLGMIEGKRHRGRQKKRWIDTIKEDTNLTLRDIKTLVLDRNKWRSLIHWITKRRIHRNG